MLYALMFLIGLFIGWLLFAQQSLTVWIKFNKKWHFHSIIKGGLIFNYYLDGEKKI